MSARQPLIKRISAVSDLVETLAVGDVVAVKLDFERLMIYEGVINSQLSFMHRIGDGPNQYIKCYRSKPQHLEVGGGAVIFDMNRFSSDTYFPRCSLEYWEKEAMLQAAPEYVGI